MVSNIFISFKCSIGTSNGFLSKITKSAFLPTLILPFLSSSKYWYAAFIVTAFNASITLILSFSPNKTPLFVFLLTAQCIVSIIFGSITGESWWNVKVIPFSKAEAVGLIFDALSNPKLLMWTSPQWYTCATKNDGMIPNFLTSSNCSILSNCEWIITGLKLFTSYPSSCTFLIASINCWAAASPLQCASICTLFFVASFIAL